ncbi:hypothetical protein XELAEV_18016277mg [Xenopus laevis]|uniref:Uncharacterized protein n=1 Tax=Xenopus laevis TaxID=8355 RepID=A0A974HWQ1_XENLA|nr:hypothetical protein XELAEV_18016277mg [Xenopus laevis]
MCIEIFELLNTQFGPKRDSTVFFLMPVSCWKEILIVGIGWLFVADDVNGCSFSVSCGIFVFVHAWFYWANIFLDSLQFLLGALCIQGILCQLSQFLVFCHPIVGHIALAFEVQNVFHY